jgi:hypothetical protein
MTPWMFHVTNLTHPGSGNPKGRPIAAPDASWWPSGDSVAGSRVPSVLSAPRSMLSSVKGVARAEAGLYSG